MNVPFHVYLIFFALLYIGIKNGKPRKIKVVRLLFSSLLIAIFSTRSIYSIVTSHLDIALWIMGIAVGMMVGYFALAKKSVQANHEQKEMLLPGDKVILSLLLAIFSFEYLIQYGHANHLDYTNSILFKYLSLVIFGFFAGAVFGRNLLYYVKYKYVEHINLYH